MGVCSSTKPKINYSIEKIKEIIQKLENVEDLKKCPLLSTEQTLQLYQTVMTTLKKNQDCFLTFNADEQETILNEMENFITQYYVHVQVIIATEGHYYLRRIVNQYILECYLAIVILKKNKTIFWNEEYFFQRRSCLQKLLEAFPRYVESKTTISPIQNFTLLLQKCCEKISVNHGIELAPQTRINTIQSNQDVFYKNLKEEFLKI